MGAAVFPQERFSSYGLSPTSSRITAAADARLKMRRTSVNAAGSKRLFAATNMVRQLRPWFANLGKRQVKSPKICFRGTGLLHQMLGIREGRDLWLHPKSGASWEGYVIEEVIKAVDPDGAYFWATHSGAELDLLLFSEGRRVGIECKRVDAPRLTPSMRIALEGLQLDQLIVFFTRAHVRIPWPSA
jgi:predicted AAA+ superfamily ATPase